ncbi:DNA recombination-mediator protein A [alpha proteobacterium HIMB5]|nr:DNA recombination-mediator protein A [alpha proteobacterium HIMB5]
MKIDEDYTWYKLLSTKGIGPKTIHKIYNNFKKQKEKSIKFDENFIEKNLDNQKHFLNWKDIKDELCFREYENVLKKNINILTLESKKYPKTLLDNLGNDSPPIIFYGGKVELFNSEGIAIVGSRNVCENGIKYTKNISKELSNEGFNIISGYAKGVDSLSHLSSLENDGTTTFVLSHGITKFKKKKEFQDKKWTGHILAVSEFLPKDDWSASRAMIRNKTIIGLSKAVVVIQSGPEKDDKGNMSGTFNSGQLAIKYKIPLFVVNPLIVEEAKGNQDLIKMGGIEIDNENAINIIKKELSKPKLKNDDNQKGFEFN